MVRQKHSTFKWRKLTVVGLSIGIIMMLGFSIVTLTQYTMHHDVKVMTIPDSTNAANKTDRDPKQNEPKVVSGQVSEEQLIAAKSQVKGLFKHLIKQSETGEFKTSTPEQIYKKWAHEYVVSDLKQSTLIVTPYGKQVQIADSDIELGDSSNSQTMQLLVHVDSKFSKEAFLFTYDAAQRKITDYKQFTINGKASVTNSAD